MRELLLRRLMVAAGVALVSGCGGKTEVDTGQVSTPGGGNSGASGAGGPGAGAGGSTSGGSGQGGDSGSSSAGQAGLGGAGGASAGAGGVMSGGSGGTSAAGQAGAAGGPGGAGGAGAAGGPGGSGGSGGSGGQVAGGQGGAAGNPGQVVCQLGAPCVEDAWCHYPSQSSTPFHCQGGAYVMGDGQDPFEVKVCLAKEPSGQCLSLGDAATYTAVSNEYSWNCSGLQQVSAPPVQVASNGEERCCYQVTTVCVGRPLVLAGRLRVSPLRRGAWG